MDGFKQCPQCAATNPVAAQLCWSCETPFVMSPPPSNPPVQNASAYSHPPNAYINPPAPSYAKGMIQVPAGSHSVVLVAVLSILFGGWVGMLINRQVVKGLVYGLLISGLLTLVTCGLAAIIVYPLTIVDAIMVANRLNRGEAVKEWQFF